MPRGMLQEASNVTGPYVDITTLSPLTIDLTEASIGADQVVDGDGLLAVFIYHRHLCTCTILHLADRPIDFGITPVASFGRATLARPFASISSWITGSR